MTTVFTPQTNLDWVVQSAYLNANPIATPVGWPAKGPADGFMLFGPHDVGAATNYTAALDALNVLRAQVPAGQNVVVAFLSDGLPNEAVAGQVFTNLLNALPTTGLTIDTFAVGVGQSAPPRRRSSGRSSRSLRTSASTARFSPTRPTQSTWCPEWSRRRSRPSPSRSTAVPRRR
jgi:hypothetical protein